MIFDPFVLPYKNISFWKKFKRYLYKTETQRSAGAVIYHRFPEGIKILLLKRGGYWNDWTFPKGRIEEDNPKDTAKREVKEEVGLEIEIINNLPINSYVFYVDAERKKITKTINYYLAEAKSVKVKLEKSPDNPEAEKLVGFKWVTLNKSINMLKHKTEKDILSKVSDSLVQI